MERIEAALRKKKIKDEIIQEIISVEYKPSDNPKQNNANYCSAAMGKCNELLDFNTIAEIMTERSCCKTGKRLNDVRKMVKEHTGEPLEVKLKLLGEIQYMGHPTLTPEGYISSNGCAGTWNGNKHECSCWSFGGLTPEEGSMPPSYCLCCAGHFTFYYQKALGIKLKVKEIENSAFMDNTKPCSFLFEKV